MVTTIVDFLRSRYDEIEAAARAATPGPWGTNHQFDEGFVTDSEGSYLVYSEGTVDIPTAEHIALHDPAYVLADIAAKRRILDAYTTTTRLRDEAADRIRAAGDNPNATDLNQWTRAHAEAALLREVVLPPLTLPFEQHPDYDDSWRP